MSRQSVWRYTRDVTPVTPAPAAPESVNGAAETGARAHDGLIDWPEELGGAVERLRESGSATATAQLARLAAAEIRAADPCENHVVAGEVTALIAYQFEVWREHLLGPLARKLAHEFDLRIDVVEDVLYGVIDTVARELNQRQEAAQGAKEQ